MIPLFAQPFPSDIEDGFEIAPEMVMSSFADKLFHRNPETKNYIFVMCSPRRLQLFLPDRHET
jgi:hypothetical protein